MSETFFMPTRLISGSDCINLHADRFDAFGKKALLVTGAHSAKDCGAEKDVITALDSRGIAYAIFDRVMSNPTVECCFEGAAVAKEEGADFIIAIGGGSPMDAGKIIAILAGQELTHEALLTGGIGSSVLPIVMVPTTAGTGSEVTQYAILTNDILETKTNIVSERIFPKLAFLDARYTQNLPLATTIHTVLDALSHAVEGMMSVRTGAITNALAIEAIQRVMAAVPLLAEIKADTADIAIAIPIDVRQSLMMASTLAGMVIANTGTTVVHAMGYSLTYFHDIDHGRANALVLPAYLSHVAEQNPDLAQKVLKALDLPSPDAFRKTIDALLGTRESLNHEDVQRFAKMAIVTRNIGNCIVKPKVETIEMLFQESMAG